MEPNLIKNQNEIRSFALICFILQATLIVSDVLTYKVTTILSMSFTIPALLYPLTYAIGDTLTEAYGRKITLMILSMAVLIEGLSDLLIAYVSTIHDTYDPLYYSSFKYSLGKMHIAALGVVTGSILGFASNTIMMYFLKTKFSYRSFPIRSIFSSLTGEIIFTISAFTIWFYSNSAVNAKELAKLILVSSWFKICFAIIYSFPAYWTAKKLIKNSLSSSESLKITNIEKISEKPGNSVFEFQITGKRTGFSSKSKKVSLNMFTALSVADQKLIEADINGKILEQIDEWARYKYATENSVNNRWIKRDRAWDSRTAIA